MFQTKILIENKLVLMARKQSKYLYARYKHPKLGVWREKSTKTWDPVEAEEIARHFFYDFTVKVKNNIPTTTRTMDKLIDLYIEKITFEHKKGAISESNFLLKRRISEKFVRPYFAKKLLHTIDRNTLTEFATWRRNYWASQPEDAVIEYMRSNGTIGHRPITAKERQSYPHMRDERAILNSLFRVAITKGWIKEWQVPKIDFKSDVIPKGRNMSQTKPDVYFTRQEIRFIKKEMWKWASRPSKFQYRRQAAYYYVMLCFNTGVRPGTALDSVCWCNIQAVQTGGNDAKSQIINGFRIEQADGGDSVGDVRLDIYVPTSKVSSYIALGLNEAFWIYQDYIINWGLMAEDLYNMQMRRTKKERVPINMQYNEKDPIFLLPNGYKLEGRQVSKYFAAFLKDKNMTYAEGTQDKRTLYSTRHSFITHMLDQGALRGAVAEFTGTSQEMFKRHYEHYKVATSGNQFKDYSKER